MERMLLTAGGGGGGMLQLRSILMIALLLPCTSHDSRGKRFLSADFPPVVGGAFA